MGKVLIVCSKNKGAIAPFISAQIESLKNEGIEVDLFGIKGKGVLGYLSNLRKLKKYISGNNYHLIHAHYGLSGLLANLQRRIPVITTYHGTDTFTFPNNIFSFICSRLSVYNILTHKLQILQLKLGKSFQVIPCGINLSIFKPMDKRYCRERLGWPIDKKIILFSSSFNRPEKNSQLAIKAIDEMAKTQDISIHELKGYDKNEVPYLINGSDAVLITSLYETGPLIAKEALACNTPVVTTPVGNMLQLKKLTENLQLVSYRSKDIREKLELVLGESFEHHSNEEMKAFDIKDVAKRIKNIYKEIDFENFN